MGQRLALIIGNSLYSDTTLSRLASPDVDVGALGEILLDSELGGFDDVNVLVNMSSHVIRRTIASFFAKRSRDDLLMLYFSGHGVLDDQGLLYLAVRDTDSKLLRGTAVSANFITDEMNNSRSQRQVLILDCCHSGAFARGTKGKPGNSVGTATAFEGTGYGRVVLTASDATQYAWEGDQVIGEAENSLFTHFLLEGIKSGAADTNGDGKITVDELYDYVYEHVIRQTPRQTPGKWSYKERGEIVIAQVLQGKADSSRVAKLMDFDPNLDERLNKLYNEGLEAYWLEEWDKAIRCFQAILEVRPDYPDAANKYDLSKRHLRLRTLYNKVLEAEQDRDWLLAVSRLEELSSLEPDYRDTRQRLENAKRNRMLSELYAEAQQLAKAGKYQAVLNVFTQISNLQPDYPDPNDLLSTAEKEVAQQQHQAELEQIYHQALREMDTGDWKAAEGLLQQLQTADPTFPNLRRLLERVQAELSNRESERQKQEQITMLSQQAVGLARAKQWHEVLAKIEEIRAIEPNFEACDQLALKAQEEIDHQTRETQREALLAEMYTEAVKLIDAGEYQKALQQWGEIRELDPKYPDRNKVQKTAKKKIKELAEPKKSRQQRSKRVILFVGLPVIIGVAILAFWIWKNLGTEIPEAGFDYDFNDRQQIGGFDNDLWVVWQTNTRNKGEAAQQGDGTMALTMGENDALIHMMPKHVKSFRLSKPTLCQTTMRLDNHSRFGNVSIEIPVKNTQGFQQATIACLIETSDNNGNQHFRCLSFSDIEKNNLESSSVDIVAGSWHMVTIELYPQASQFRVEMDGKFIYRSPTLDLFENSTFDCKIQVHNYSGSEVTGYFNDFRIKNIDIDQ